MQERGFRLPDGYLDFAPQVDATASGPRAYTREPTVPCNNDLLAANIIDDGDRLWLIDYEYSGNNDPCFELGNIWSEAALTLERARRARRGVLRHGAAPPSPARGSGA